MSDKKKVLVVLTPAFPANETELNWMQSQQLFLESVQRLFPYIKIKVISFIYPGTGNNYAWQGAEVFSFRGNKYRRLKRPLLWRMIWKKLNEINKDEKIDALFSFWCGECALVGEYFGRRKRISHYSWICGQDARADNKFVKFIRPSPVSLIAKSDFLVEEFYRNHRVRPAYMIPNGISPSGFPAISNEREIDLIGVGSLSFLKQYEIFIEIVAELKKIYPELKAVLCGEGEAEQGLKKMASDLKLEQNLLFTGELPPHEVKKMMIRSKILLHPSSYEGFSMSCLEALFAGADVISFVRAMKIEIKNWHIVQTKNEMLEKAKELLMSNKRDYEQVKVFTMDESAEKIIRLMRLA